MFGSRKTQTTPGAGPLPSGAPASAEKALPEGSGPTKLPVGFETVIGMNTALQGELTSHANVRIDGRFEGAISIDGNMMVGETADIRAGIHAHNVTVAGAVHGNITGNKIHVARTGRIWGDISAASLSTEEGAYIEGKVTMASHPAARGERASQPALSAPESPEYHAPVLSGEDTATGEMVDVEFVEDPPPGA